MSTRSTTPLSPVGRPPAVETPPSPLRSPLPAIGRGATASSSFVNTDVCSCSSSAGGLRAPSPPDAPPTPSSSALTLDRLIDEYNNDENDETPAERSARTAGQLGLSVLGIGLGELLKGQLAHETDQTRLRAAFECVEQSLARLASTNLRLLSKLKSPPGSLMLVLEPVLLLLRQDLSSPAPPPAEPSLASADTSWPQVSDLFVGAGGVSLLQRLHDFPLSALDPELVELLDPYFMSISHAQASGGGGGGYACMCREGGVGLRGKRGVERKHLASRVRYPHFL